MPESSSDLSRRTDPQPGKADPVATPAPFPGNGLCSDEAPTIISKNLVRPATAEEALNNLRGRRLAHFELLEAIGVGGMAAVLRARDTQLDRIVALKILPPEMANEPENVRRFHQEARSAAKLDHENIARVFYCGEDQRLHFIAFEFVEGDNLRTLLDKRGRLPVGEALHYLVQVAAGLNHAYARGVVHRDIKPSNIIITPHSRAKLVDMGLARDLAIRADKGLTQSGVTLGTFDYISPEQALEPRDADVRSDIYSLGCTFYHMLTGVAPVPEGTAAKKLHHHQHVKPTDPRELAPNVPDQVAMILARMMAKNPRDRYQTPEQLVHDLLRAMRQLGTGGDVPEGVLAVEASLPQPPSSRPIIFVVASVAAVVALVLALAPTATPTLLDHRAPTDPIQIVREGPTIIPGDGQVKEPPKKPPTEPQAARGATYDDSLVTADKLAAWLKDHDGAEELTIVLARDLDWQVHDDDRGLLVRARKVSIRSKDRDRPVTIRLSYGSAKLTPRAALTIDSHEAMVEGVRVVLDSSTPQAMTGLQFLGQPGGRYRVEHCEFAQARKPLDEGQRLASVVLDAHAAGHAAGPALLFLRGCAFLGYDSLQWETDLQASTFDLLLQGSSRGGQDAVVRRGHGRIEATDCAFGPHAQTFRFEGGSNADVAELTHCTIMSGHGCSVFYFLEDAAATLDVQHTLFGRPGGDDPANDRGGTLINQNGDRSAVTYLGADNRYYNLDTFWTGETRAETDYTEFVRKLKDKEKVSDFSGDDKDSRVLLEAPWADKAPLKRLEATRYFVQFDGGTKLPTDAQKQTEKQLADVFQVKRDARDLRAGDDPAKRLIGVERLVMAINYTANLDRLNDGKPATVARRKLIVDPAVATMSEKGIYKSLPQAISDAQSGDIILIRHKGTLRVDPINLKTANLDLTIRPDADSQPILTIFETDGDDPDTSMFRVCDGKVRFENLEFRLQPTRKYNSQSVAALAGDGQCSFQDCVVTLDPADLNTHLAAVTLTDNRDLMKMKAPPPGTVSQTPGVAFTNCFVRGSGDLLWCRMSRPLTLDLQNSLVALLGNVLNVEVPEAAPTTATSSNVNVTINHLTAYVSGYFVRVKASKELKGLVPLKCNATGSLFVAAATGQPFIHLDGLAPDNDKLKDKLPWTGDGNVYGGYTEMLNQQPPPPDDDPRPLPIMKNEWAKFTGDSTSRFVPMVKFPLGETPPPFGRMTPSLFKQSDVDAGANLQLVPKPGADDR